MNKRLVLNLSMILLVSAGFASTASAQEKTRAEVRQELIQAENNGLRFVTDTSYPGLCATGSPAQAAKRKRHGCRHVGFERRRPARSGRQSRHRSRSCGYSFLRRTGQLLYAVFRRLTQQHVAHANRLPSTPIIH
jgi:hypothetical protein